VTHQQSILKPFRYFETEDWNGVPGQWWFGGGTDITPSYLDVEDMKHFHGTYKKVGGELKPCCDLPPTAILLSHTAKEV
jgi:coproporphyrinogen III oxidase